MKNRPPRWTVRGERRRGGRSLGNNEYDELQRHSFLRVTALTPVCQGSRDMGIGGRRHLTAAQIVTKLKKRRE
jgi:hypothetical protein